MFPNQSPSTDIFTIPQEQRAKYEDQFIKLAGSRSSFISGEQGRNLLIKSNLQPLILARIWQLSDHDSDGRLSIGEFSIALHLIALKLRGHELPDSLPPALKLLVEPGQAFGAAFPQQQPAAAPINVLPQNQQFTTSSFPSSLNSATPPIPGAAKPSAGPPPRPVPPSGQALAMSGGSGSHIAASGAKIQRSGSLTGEYPPSMLLTEWAIPQPSKLKYTQQFNTNDRQRTGFLTGVQARHLLMQSGLPQNVLAQIWNLSDIDVDGRLTCDEFVLAMHLIDCVRSGDPLPTVLPHDLVPPSYRRKRAMSMSVSGGVNPSLPMSGSIPIQLGDQSEINVNTFEDKRRENFEKGQAELERRRQTLLDQQRREQEERERKEREEAHKREMIRLEQERRKREEMERQLMRQREIEAEKEEQRRKATEQREAARREMERTRMLEWEAQRKQDLMTQKERTAEEVAKLRSRKKALAIEMEQVNNKVNELTSQVTETRKKVAEVKSEIDGMRLERDQKMGLLSSIKAQIKGLTDRQLIIEQEKVKLAQTIKNMVPVTANADTSITNDQFALQNKQMSIIQMKEKMEEYEKEKEAKALDLANSNGQLDELKEKLKEIIDRTRNLSKDYQAKRKQAIEVRDKLMSSDVNATWGDAGDTGWAAEEPQADENANDPNRPKVSAFKFIYHCLHAFEARNPDELAIQPGDNIVVNTSAQSEPGWLTGELNGKHGWFPEAYVEKTDEPVLEPSNGISAATQEPIKQSFAEPPEEANVTISISEPILKAQAIYPWKAKEDNHLSFNKGEIITIKEQQDAWWLGELGGNQGWFPKSYVKLVGAANEDEEEELGQHVKQHTEGEYCVALYPFESQEEGDLAFDGGQLIRVIKKEGDWWTGVIGTNDKDSRQGVFPSNYVRAANQEEIPKPVYEQSAPKPAKAKPKAPPAPINTDKTPLAEGEKSKLKKPEVVTVIAPYKATGPEQLSLERGQLLSVRKKNDSGWWEGEIVQKGKKKQVGWFPASYVKSLSSGSGNSSPARSTPEPASAGVSTTSTKQKAPKPPVAEPQPDAGIEKVITVYEFKAQHDDELSFQPNEIIKVLAKDDETWWKGQSMSTGVIGLFPSNHVEIYREYEEIEDYYCEPTEEPYQQSETNTHPYAYIDDNEVDPTIEDDNNHPDDELQFDDSEEFEDEVGDELVPQFASNNSKQQIAVNGTKSSSQHQQKDLNKSQSELAYKRQNAIEELIKTEKSYVRDMEIVIDVFQAPLQAKNCLTKEEANLIFVNWFDLVNCNKKFLKSLQARIREYDRSYSVPSTPLIISDLIISHLNSMAPIYIQFCSQQLAAAKLIQRKTENNPTFKETAQACAQDKRANRLPLSSYLLKPMQRITKYPLLIGKVVEYTAKDDVSVNGEYSACQEALRVSQQLCNTVNEACRQKQDNERLEWVQKHVKCDTLDQRLIFNSTTNCLGPRQLIHSGSLIKANSNKELIAFLFNDFLMLTLSYKELGKVNNVFSSEKALHSHYRIYKTPIMLNDINITELAQFETSLDPCLFQLYIHSQERHLILKTSSVNERALWIKSIDVASRRFKDVEREKKDKKLAASSHGIGRLFVTVLEGIQLSTKNNILNAFIRLSIISDKNHFISSYSSDLHSIHHSNHVSYVPSSQSHSTKVIRCIPTSPTDKSSSAFIPSQQHKSSPTLNHSNNSSHSTHTSSHHQLFHANWKDSTQFIIANLSELLLIEVYDKDLYAPNYLIGSAMIEMNDLREESQAMCGPVNKQVKLNLSDPNMRNEVKSMVYLKLDLQMFET